VDPGRLAIARAVADIADGLGLTSSVVALAWLRAQGSSIPILGARTAQQLADNLTCLDVNLPPDALARLDQPATSPAASRTTSWPALTSSSVVCPASSTCHRAGPQLSRPHLADSEWEVPKLGDPALDEPARGQYIYVTLRYVT
jgi:hypothetical protein